MKRMNTDEITSDGEVNDHDGTVGDGKCPLSLAAQRRNMILFAS